MDKQDYDSSKAEGFLSKMFQFLNGGMLSLMISIGYKTGLFDIISELKPSTSQEISEATKLNERYIREWLGAMVTGNIIKYDPLTRKYYIPKEHSAFLTRKSGIDNLAVLTQYVSLMGNVEDKIVECFRNGGGLHYSEYPKFQQLQAEETARIFDSMLTNQILPLIPEINNRLKDGIKVLDIGCGGGRAINLMGEADQAQPTKVLKAIYESLDDDGFFLMQDIAASSKVEKNIDSLLAPTLYTISTMHCMSVALAFNGEGLGTMWGKELAVKKLTEAGFKDINVKSVEEDIMNYYYLARK
jgi:hypothetical protein